MQQSPAQFQYLYGLRNTTETVNNMVKSRISHMLHDAPGQLLRALGVAVGINAYAWNIAEQAAGRPNAIDHTLPVPSLLSTA